MTRSVLLYNLDAILRLLHPIMPFVTEEIFGQTADSELEAFFNDYINYIKRFTNPEKLGISSAIVASELAMSAVITGAELYLPLADLLNVSEELDRLNKELTKWQKELDMVTKKLSNERFVANAKPEVVDAERQKQTDYQTKFDATKQRIAEMEKLVK